MRNPSLKLKLLKTIMAILLLGWLAWLVCEHLQLSRQQSRQGDMMLREVAEQILLSMPRDIAAAGAGGSGRLQHPRGQRLHRRRCRRARGRALAGQELPPQRDRFAALRHLRRDGIAEAAVVVLRRGGIVGGARGGEEHGDSSKTEDRGQDQQAAARFHPAAPASGPGAADRKLPSDRRSRGQPISAAIVRACASRREPMPRPRQPGRTYSASIARQ